MSSRPSLNARLLAVRLTLGRVLAAALAGAIALALAGCTNPQPAPDPSASTAVADPRDPRAQLAGLAAAAKDRHFFAGYALSQPGRPDRLIVVTMATDGSWRFDVPGGALGGQADISVAGNRDGLYQCRVGATGSTAAPYCVKVAPAGGVISFAYDPRIQHPFTDWLSVLTDRRAALSVAAAPLLPGATGSCFSVEPSAAALLAPIDAGVYCYDRTGALTGARLGLGTLTLTSPISAPPPTAPLPGPIVDTAPLTIAAPPPPPSRSASPTRT